MKVKELKKNLQLVYKGELFGESVALEFVEQYIKKNPKSKEKLFELIKINLSDVFETDNIDDYFEYIEKQYQRIGFTVVDLYNFDTNDEGENLILDILENIEKGEL